MICGIFKTLSSVNFSVPIHIFRNNTSLICLFLACLWVPFVNCLNLQIHAYIIRPPLYLINPQKKTLTSPNIYIIHKPNKFNQKFSSEAEMVKGTRYMKNLGEVVPSLAVASRRRCSACPKLETIVEEGSSFSESFKVLFPPKEVFLLVPVFVSTIFIFTFGYGDMFFMGK